MESNNCINACESIDNRVSLCFSVCNLLLNICGRYSCSRIVSSELFVYLSISLSLDVVKLVFKSVNNDSNFLSGDSCEKVSAVLYRVGGKQQKLILDSCGNSVRVEDLLVDGGQCCGSCDLKIDLAVIGNVYLEVICKSLHKRLEIRRISEESKLNAVFKVLACDICRDNKFSENVVLIELDEGIEIRNCAEKLGYDLVYVERAYLVNGLVVEVYALNLCEENCEGVVSYLLNERLYVRNLALGVVENVKSDSLVVKRCNNVLSGFLCECLYLFYAYSLNYCGELIV